ncbi:LptE family protein [Pedobacter metabolipauper]|uniref:Lipopolysaccharide assembly protein n=1 Tax=Pedobacter metabolipauper TaxID=425513 RepID=A0A4R6SU18_9SPHI|nr:LptE family protein [Pedobacter metabolipauper]TDQ09258.1 lipopolysaccharide assembly protein [Pedobacter metabolipauper]
MKNLYILMVLFVFSGCKIGLNGASIPADMKTVNVTAFENNAPLVVASLSSEFTESLKTRIRNQTRLSLTTNEAHGVFSGNITGYEITPEAIQDNNQPTAGANRLTIRINVKYINNLNPKQSFEESFERYKVFKLTGSLQAQEPGLIKDVTAQLTEDIFNRAFAQW